MLASQDVRRRILAVECGNNWSECLDTLIKHGLNDIHSIIDYVCIAIAELQACNGRGRGRTLTRQERHSDS